MLLPYLLLTLLLPVSTTSASLTISVPPSPPLLPNPHSLPASTHATLQASGHHLSAPFSRSNTFVFSNLTDGSYLLEVHCHDFLFPALRVDVSRTIFTEPKDDGTGVEVRGLELQAWRTYWGNEWDNKGPSMGGGQVREGEDGDIVVEVRPLIAKDYYQQRAGCKCPIESMSREGKHGNAKI